MGVPDVSAGRGTIADWCRKLVVANPNLSLAEDIGSLASTDDTGITRAPSQKEATDAKNDAVNYDIRVGSWTEKG